MSPNENLESEGPSRSCTLPAGVEIVPRKFEFRDLDSMPQYWFGGNALITHIENSFFDLDSAG